MTSESELEVIDVAVRDAVSATWASFESFDNEAHFKFELFHNLAMFTIDGVGLADQVPGTCTCRLHAEAKPQTGQTSQKADLLICDPLRRMEFNYEPVALLELKHRLSKAELALELAKAKAYVPLPRRLFVISAHPARLSVGEAEMAAANSPFPVTVLFPEWTSDPVLKGGAKPERLGPSEVHTTVDAVIDEALALYGSTCHNRTHAFYWRNFEYGLAARWTYPCEADFLAHIYHRLRISVPEANIRVEVPPDAGRGRIDLVISVPPSINIAVEAKMNWDQFKPKYKDRQLKQSEADNLLSKVLV